MTTFTHKHPQKATTGKHYTKKAITVEAMQYGPNPLEAARVYRWVEKNTKGSYDTSDPGKKVPSSGVSINAATGSMVLATLEGEMQVSLGDWVIRGIKGEFYPCKPEIFRETYTPAHTRRPRTTTPEHSGDMVNHPTHYTTHPAFPGEAWDYTRHMSFALGNAFKYLWRAGTKDNMFQDLEKARWYINHARPGEFTHSLDETTVDELHRRLTSWVHAHPFAKIYMRGLGTLDNPSIPCPLPRAATVEELVRLEAWTALVLMLMGDDVASIALGRAMRLALKVR